MHNRRTRVELPIYWAACPSPFDRAVVALGMMMCLSFAASVGVMAAYGEHSAMDVAVEVFGILQHGPDETP